MKTNKLIAFLVLIVSMMSFIPTVKAASASINISSSTGTVVEGGTITTTVKISSSSPIGVWEYSLNYDSSMLTLKSGTTHIASYASSGSTYSQTYTYTFTAKKSGSTSISVKNYSVIGWDEKSMSTSVSTSSVKIITQSELQASYSSNNDLSALSVSGAELSPAFDADVTEYTVELEPKTESINISATAADSKSKITGAGEHQVTDGNNKIEILVTAQNGSIQKYIINAVVKELEPIEITLNGNEYTVIRTEEDLTKPLYFTETSISINDKDVPGYYNEQLGYSLVGLKDSDGNVKLYIYDIEENSFEEYVEFSFEALTLQIIEFNEEVMIPDGYDIYTIVIGEEKIESYKTNAKSNYALVYAMNIETGNKNLYSYDLVEGTMQIYNAEKIEKVAEEEDIYKLCSGIFAGINIVLLLIILTGSSKKKKKTKKVKSDFLNEDSEANVQPKIKKEKPEKKLKKEKKKKSEKKETEDDF